MLWVPHRVPTGAQVISPLTCINSKDLTASQAILTSRQVSRTRKGALTCAFLAQWVPPARDPEHGNWDRARCAGTIW